MSPNDLISIILFIGAAGVILGGIFHVAKQVKAP